MILYHVGHPAGREHYQGKGGSSPNELHEHSKDKSDCAWVPADITQDALGVAAKYGTVEDVCPIINKVGIDTGDYVLRVTMSRKLF